MRSSSLREEDMVAIVKDPSLVEYIPRTPLTKLQKAFHSRRCTWQASRDVSQVAPWLEYSSTVASPLQHRHMLSCSPATYKNLQDFGRRVTRSKASKTHFSVTWCL